MLERQSEFFLLPVQQTEVEMRLRVVRTEIDRALKKRLRFVMLAFLEEDQSEVGVEDEDVRILADQSSIDHFRFGEGVGLEVDEAERKSGVWGKSVDLGG